MALRRNRATSIGPMAPLASRRVHSALTPSRALAIACRRAQETDQFGPVPGAAEQECHTECVWTEMQLADRAFPENAKLPAALVADLVDRPGRSPPHLLGAQRLDQALTLHLAEFPIQRADAHPAPVADVRLLRIPPDLVAVARAVRQQAEHHQS